MEAREHFFQLETLYDQIPPMTCLNCQECCPTERVGCYAIEYQYIKKYVKKKFSSRQKELLEKRISRNRFIETTYLQKRKIFPRLPCVFMDSQHKKCLVYPARPILCRLNGLKGDKGSCENVKISSSQNFNIKHKKYFLKQIKQISSSYTSKNNESSTDFDFLRNWLFRDRFGVESCLPLKKDEQFYGVNFDEFII